MFESSSKREVNGVIFLNNPEKQDIIDVMYEFPNCDFVIKDRDDNGMAEVVCYVCDPENNYAINTIFKIDYSDKGNYEIVHGMDRMEGCINGIF